MTRAVRLWFWLRVMDLCHYAGATSANPRRWRAYMFAVSRASDATDWGRP